MTIDYALLGMLSWKPLSGYDMKRMIQASPVMYWSGNNNQIYRSLVKLLKQGYVTNELHCQEGAPDKKIYHLTDSGRAAFQKWLLHTSPETPEFRKTFLIQLSWAGELPTEQLASLMKQYEDLMEELIRYHKHQHWDKNYFPDRNPREICLWEGIYDNILMSLETELAWIRGLKEKILKLEP